MEKTSSLKWTGNQFSYQCSTFAGLESATNADLKKIKAEMEEVQEGHDANQETRNPPKLGLVIKIQRMFCWTDKEKPEPKQGQRVSLEMMLH